VLERRGSTTSENQQRRDSQRSEPNSESKMVKLIPNLPWKFDCPPLHPTVMSISTHAEAYGYLAFLSSSLCSFRLRSTA